ncbi:hypothetical protein GRI62_06540 [Erythrobacter arachoides]|uniref:Uncharacterized protein n=1 Tax=Aurantiacibacter arachoides TaxID=1850444 RepID=A0A845A0M0_9SPHN|nr:hypothetical protein [Aurantiacibacter arachoides]MXO93264.1 hypothetical protein [Aurantiacibacter arachoides]GGD50685.1 hypothetical protein GCM10011411_08200 [Aurantiacibacter arachoides]
MKDEQGWLTSANLRDVLAEVTPGAGTQELIDALGRGYITGRAKYVDVVKSAGRLISEHENWNIPRKLWSHRNSRLDLESDQFEGRVAINEGGLLGVVGAAEFRCDRLLFNQAEVREFFKLPPVSAGSGSETGGRKKGRSPAAGWPIFAAALALWVERQNDTADQFAALGSDELWKQIDTILTVEWGREGLARTTFQPAIQEFLKRMKEEAVRRE